MQADIHSFGIEVKFAFLQGMVTCGPKGRDCIERNSIESFNCSVTCEGVYADVQWVGNKIEEMKDEEAEEAVETEIRGKNNEELNKLLKRLADLEKEMKVLKSSGQEKGEELDKEKYKMLIAEYRKFKTKNLKHIRFNSGYIFGKSLFPLF